MGFTRSQGEGGNELLEALALDIAQLLGAWAHDVVRWRDVGSGLSGGDVSFNVDANSVYTAITARQYWESLTALRSRPCLGGPDGGVPWRTGLRPSCLTCRCSHWRGVCWWSGRPEAALVLGRPFRMCEFGFCGKLRRVGVSALDEEQRSGRVWRSSDQWIG